MTQIWSIPGGIHPPENKTQSLQEPLAEMGVPSHLVFPVNQHIGKPAIPCVEIGARVLGGQCIAKADGPISANIHASSSGTVVAIEERPLPHPSGLAGDCIVIETDGKDEFLPAKGIHQYLQADKETVLGAIRNAGLAGMGGAGFPSAIKLNPRGGARIDTLIINGTECEPYITADDILMKTRPEDIVRGTELLAHLLHDPERVVIGVEDNKPEAIRILQQTIQKLDSRVEVVSFPTKYPSGGEKQLIQILTGQEVPAGKLPADIGVVVQNVGTTVAALEAVRDGKPLTQRITTIVGKALDTQRNVIVRLGTPIDYLLDQHGFKESKCERLVMGGPMMGFSLPDASVPVVKTTNCILAPTRKELPPPSPAQACIRCGLCAEACPASLLPQQLFWYTQAEDYERVKAHNIADCIECGACAYVCPSHIPLVQYYRSAKGTIRLMDIEKEKSDRSRQRFEFRKARIEKAEAEKEAKREARRKAAEAAKVKAAEQPAASAPAAPQKSSEDQYKKLQRSVTSAQSRVDKLKQKVAEAENEEQTNKLTAQLKQAEVRLSDAQAKMDALGNSSTAATAPADPNDPVAAAIAKAQAKMSMSPAEKLQSNIESLQKRLAKAEQKLADAEASGADTVEILRDSTQKLRDKIATAEKELAELGPVTPAPATAEQDAASAAIERAKANAAAQASMSPLEKKRQQLDSLKKRIDKAEQKLASASEDTAEIVRQSIDKLKEKRAATEAEIAELDPAATSAAKEAPAQPATAVKQATPATEEAPAQPATEAKQATPAAEETPAEPDAATAAIEKAKAKAAAMASMSPEQKKQEQLEALQKRQQKARQRLEKAEQEDDPNIDAFRTAVEKINSKIADAEAELETL